MKTTSHIIVTLIALLLPAMASANVYENRVKQALENITQKANISNIGLTYSNKTDPETGGKDSELRVVKFKLGNRDIYLIDEAVAVYQQINDDSRDGEVPYLYTLWFNTANKDRIYSGINLYYSHENSILVGTDADNCYTVGFFLSENTNYRNTYTLEWDNTEGGDSLKGRIITTFGPIKAKANSGGSKFIPFDYSYNGRVFEQLQANMEKYQKGMEKYQAAIGKAEGTSVVTGKVTDENGEPLIGALVLPIGGGFGATTDKDGDFSLTIHNHVTQLQVSYFGYKTQVFPVEPNMAIKMTPSKTGGSGISADDSDLSDLFLRVPDRNKSLTPSKPNSQDWMKKLLFYLDKIQREGSESRYIYLSKLYELCKNTDGLDQQDLKIALQQVAICYKKLKSKNTLQENELLFLQGMADVLESKIH